MGRYHLYVDESGQPGLGGFFIPCAIAIASKDLDTCREHLEFVEVQSGRLGRKWVRSTRAQKESFLALIEGLLVGSQVSVFWSLRPNEGNLVNLTALFIADVAAGYRPRSKFHVVIDGYPEKALQEVRAAFRDRQVAWTKIAGHRDEGEPFLRFADAMAGFLSDVHKEKAYTARYWKEWERHFNMA